MEDSVKRSSVHELKFQEEKREQRRNIRRDND